MSALFVIGQVVLGVYFFLSGLKHFTGMKGMVGYATMKGAPAPSLTVPLTGLMLLVGGIGVLFQWNTTLAYWLLIAFLVLSAFMIHNFWSAKDPQTKMADTIQFQKNIAIAAALLMLLGQ